MIIFATISHPVTLKDRGLILVLRDANKYLPKKANVGKSANIPKKLVPSYLQQTITAD